MYAFHDLRCIALCQKQISMCNMHALSTNANNIYTFRDLRCIALCQNKYPCVSTKPWNEECWLALFEKWISLPSDVPGSLRSPMTKWNFHNFTRCILCWPIVAVRVCTRKNMFSRANVLENIKVKKTSHASLPSFLPEKTAHPCKFRVRSINLWNTAVGYPAIARVEGGGMQVPRRSSEVDLSNEAEGIWALACGNMFFYRSRSYQSQRTWLYVLTFAHFLIKEDLLAGSNQIAHNLFLQLSCNRYGYLLFSSRVCWKQNCPAMCIA